MKSLCTNCGKATRPICPDCVRTLARQQAAVEVVRMVQELAYSLRRYAEDMAEQPPDKEV